MHVPREIVHEAAGIVQFNLVQDKQILRVAYEGRDPLPDTFRDGAQALADGRLGRRRRLPRL